MEYKVGVKFKCIKYYDKDDECEFEVGDVVICSSTDTGGNKPIVLVGEDYYEEGNEVNYDFDEHIYISENELFLYFEEVSEVKQSLEKLKVNVGDKVKCISDYRNYKVGHIVEIGYISTKKIRGELVFKVWVNSGSDAYWLMEKQLEKHFKLYNEETTKENGENKMNKFETIFKEIGRTQLFEELFSTNIEIKEDTDFETIYACIIDITKIPHNLSYDEVRAEYVCDLRVQFDTEVGRLKDIRIAKELEKQEKLEQKRLNKKYPKKEDKQ